MKDTVRGGRLQNWNKTTSRTAGSHGIVWSRALAKARVSVGALAARGGGAAPKFDGLGGGEGSGDSNVKFSAKFDNLTRQGGRRSARIFDTLSHPDSQSQLSAHAPRAARRSDFRFSSPCAVLFTPFLNLRTSPAQPRAQDPTPGVDCTGYSVNRHHAIDAPGAARHHLC